MKTKIAMLAIFLFMASENTEAVSLAITKIPHLKLTGDYGEVIATDSPEYASVYSSDEIDLAAVSTLTLIRALQEENRRLRLAMDMRDDDLKILAAAADSARSRMRSLEMAIEELRRKLNVNVVPPKPARTVRK